MNEPTTVKLLFGEAETEQRIKAIANTLKSIGFPDAELYARGFLAVEDEANNLPGPNQIQLARAVKNSAIANPDGTLSILEFFQKKVFTELKNTHDSPPDDLYRMFADAATKMADAMLEENPDA